MKKKGPKAKDKDSEQPQKLSKHKKIVFTAIEQQMDELNEIGEDIWRFNELPGKEFKSPERISSFLRRKGWHVQDNYMGIKHSFCATFGDDQIGGSPHPNFGLVCVYDADQNTGHSHGHNLVTVVSLTAAIGIQTVIAFATKPMGKVTVLGCPGCDTKTAKIRMFEAGCFKGIDFLFVAYPSHYTNIKPTFVGARNFRVTYRGRPRSDKDRPWEGANPVNACVLAYQNVSALRQQFLPDWTVKGVISSGGKEAVVQPESSTMEYLLKAPKAQDIKTLNDKVNECFVAAATATGCRVEFLQTVEEFLCNARVDVLSEIYMDNAKLNGFTFHNMKTDLEDEDDIANVSTSIPVLKVFYYAGSPSAAEIGTDEFNRYAGSKDAQFMSTVQGKTLAMMAVDLMTKPELMRIIFEQHQNALMLHFGNSDVC